MSGVIGPCVSLNRRNQYVSDSVSATTHTYGTITTYIWYNVRQTYLYEKELLFCIIRLHWNSILHDKVCIIWMVMKRTPILYSTYEKSYLSPGNWSGWDGSLEDMWSGSLHHSCRGVRSLQPGNVCIIVANLQTASPEFSPHIHTILYYMYFYVWRRSIWRFVHASHKVCMC